MKTLIELTKEINQIAGELATAESGLRQIESAGRDDSKTLDMYNRLRTKAELLKRRQGELEAQRPAAELENLKAAADNLQKEAKEAMSEYQQAVSATETLLKPLFAYPEGLGPLTSAINSALLVLNARAASQNKNNAFSDATRKACRFAGANGLKYQ